MRSGFHGNVQNAKTLTSQPTLHAASHMWQTIYHCISYYLVPFGVISFYFWFGRKPASRVKHGCGSIMMNVSSKVRNQGFLSNGGEYLCIPNIDRSINHFMCFYFYSHIDNSPVCKCNSFVLANDARDKLKTCTLKVFCLEETQLCQSK